MDERLATLGHRFLFVSWRLLVVSLLVTPLLGFLLDHHFGERIPGHSHLVSEEDLSQDSTPKHLHFFQVPHDHWHGASVISPRTALALVVRGIGWQSENEGDSSDGRGFVAGLPHAVHEVSSIALPEAEVSTDLPRYHDVILIPPDPPPVNA